MAPVGPLICRTCAGTGMACNCFEMIGHALRTPALIPGQSLQILSQVSTVCTGYSTAGSAPGARSARTVVRHRPRADEAHV
eukprot:1798950-Pyramimonas_sp.AAC.2